MATSMARALFYAVCAAVVLVARCQENSGNTVSPSLIECYNQSGLLDRDSRPPASINVLIDIIRKIEDGPTLLDAKQLAVNLLHRFRQDGILRSSRVSSNSGVLPYSASGFQKAKHGMLLKKLVPGNAQIFPNETLTATERCSMHFMLSNSIDSTKRGDEDHVCSKLSRYQMRVTRDVNPKNDVEFIDDKRDPKTKGNLVEGAPDVEVDPNVEIDYNNNGPVPMPPLSGRGVVTIETSDCPIENGVIYTKWGPVAAGNVIAGIAAGLEPQVVPGLSTTIGDKQIKFDIDNRYAATLTGDLSETALHQGPTDMIDVGCAGGWNNSQVPRWYFIEKDDEDYWYLTDAELRGGLDGLVMALNVKEWMGKASNLKLSQILDMYYSPVGVFSRQFRACNRREYLANDTQRAKLETETLAFSLLLNSEAPQEVSIVGGDIFQNFSHRAVEKMTQYALNQLNDIPCTVYDSDTFGTVSSNITIILDTQWPYEYILPILSQLLNNVDVHKYGSNVSIVNARDGQTMLNNTNSLTDFYLHVNRTTYQMHPTGFDATKAINMVDVIARQTMDDERQVSTFSEKAMLFIIIPYSVGLTGTEKNFATERHQYFKQYLPDVRVLAASKTPEAFRELASDPATDLFTITETADGTTVFTNVQAIIDRCKEIPRRIANPNCGSDWSGEPMGTNTVVQHVEPRSINFYRISANYFYGDGEDNVNLKIVGQAATSLVVCHSRQNPLPRSSNNTSLNGADNCQTISTNEYQISLSGGCDGYDDIVSCPPLYFSVESKDDNANPAAQCADSKCRFPNSIKYSITTEGLRCENGVPSLVASIFLMVSMLFLRVLY